jgi:uncharacterized protein YbdZ (MbtH family)
VIINPFNDETGRFFVLVRATQPVASFADVPAGRRVVYAEADRAECSDYIEQNWTDTPRAGLFICKPCGLESDGSR